MVSCAGNSSICICKLYITVVHHQSNFSTCGTDPNVVIMDATSLAFRKDLLTWQAFLKTPTEVNRRPGR